MDGLKEKVIFMYGWGPEESSRAETLLHLAETAKAMDLEVSIFLFIDGVLLAKKGVARMISVEIAEELQKVLEGGIKVYVCESALRSKGILKEDLIEGVSVLGYATFLKMSLEAKSVITL